jgi:hypothetical protein
MNGLVADGEKPLTVPAVQRTAMAMAEASAFPTGEALSLAGEVGDSPAGTAALIPGGALDRASEYSLQYLRGKSDPASVATVRSLKQVLDVLQVSEPHCSMINLVDRSVFSAVVFQGSSAFPVSPLPL